MNTFVTSSNIGTDIDTDTSLTNDQDQKLVKIMSDRLCELGLIVPTHEDEQCEYVYEIVECVRAGITADQIFPYIMAGAFISTARACMCAKIEPAESAMWNEINENFISFYRKNNIDHANTILWQNYIKELCKNDEICNLVFGDQPNMIENLKYLIDKKVPVTKLAELNNFIYGMKDIMIVLKLTYGK